VARAEPGVLETIAEALKGPFLLAITYAGAAGAVAERRVAPHGVLLGMRRYLVARDEDRDPALRHFRVDRIRAARLLGASFTREPGFDIAAHAARAFGSYQDEARYGEVAWRFSPAAAPTARDFVFHPGQRLEEQPDGSLVVRFTASGWLEMAWHLYQWGDQVEVLAPDGLRAMVEDHRRGDFEALP
jgi:predicted DNA-binding transcriptional regulator YafY